MFACETVLAFNANFTDSVFHFEFALNESKQHFGSN